MIFGSIEGEVTKFTSRGVCIQFTPQKAGAPAGAAPLKMDPMGPVFSCPKLDLNLNSLAAATSPLLVSYLPIILCLSRSCLKYIGRMQTNMEPFGERIAAALDRIAVSSGKLGIHLTDLILISCAIHKQKRVGS